MLLLLFIAVCTKKTECCFIQKVRKFVKNFFKVINDQHCQCCTMHMYFYYNILYAAYVSLVHYSDVCFIHRKNMTRPFEDQTAIVSIYLKCAPVCTMPSL